MKRILAICCLLTFSMAANAQIAALLVSGGVNAIVNVGKGLFGPSKKPDQTVAAPTLVQAAPEVASAASGQVLSTEAANIGPDSTASAANPVPDGLSAAASNHEPPEPDFAAMVEKLKAGEIPMPVRMAAQSDFGTPNTPENVLKIATRAAADTAMLPVLMRATGGPVERAAAVVAQDAPLAVPSTPANNTALLVRGLLSVVFGR